MNKVKIIEKLATAFGLGDIPKAPGTFGTLAGIPFVIGLSVINNNYIYLTFIIAFFIFSVYISNEAEKIYEEKDAQNIVIDEVLGYIVTMFMVPVSVITIILGFVLFRIFDITKVYPIRNLQNIKGGLGIVVDDFLAGIFANIVLQIIIIFIKI